MTDNTPSGVTIWVEEFIRALEKQASSEVLDQHFRGLTPDDVQLRLLVLAQMVATNTNTNQRREWALRMITDMARRDLSEEP